MRAGSRRSWPAPLLVLVTELAWASPVLAFTPLGRLDPPDIPAPGHWQLETDAWYTPYTETLDGVPQAKDCLPGQTSADCTPGRPVISRHWAEAGFGGEVGLARGVGLTFRIPVDVVIQYEQDPAKLPAGLPPRNVAVGDVTVGLDRSLVDRAATHVKVRLAGSAAPMGSPGGNYVYQANVLDAAGNPVSDASGNPVTTTDVVFPDPPSVGLEFAAAQDLLDTLRLTFNAAVTYPLVRTGPEPVTSWNGTSYAWGAGLGWWALPGLGANLDLLGDWTNPAQQDDVRVPSTGYDIWYLSPGLAYQLDDDTTLGANALIPVFATGYQWDFIYPLLGAVSLRFDL